MQPLARKPTRAISAASLTAASEITSLAAAAEPISPASGASALLPIPTHEGDYGLLFQFTRVQ